MNEFQKWWDAPKALNYEQPTFQKDEAGDFSRTVMFVNETFKVSQAIYKDLGLRDESLLFAIYDRVIDRLNSMDQTDYYGASLESNLRHWGGSPPYKKLDEKLEKMEDKIESPIGGIK